MIAPRREAFRHPSNYALALVTEAASPLLRLAARAATGRTRPPREWRKGLILAHSHIGDVLYRTPSLGPLREALPDCEWTFLTSPGGAEVLRGNPHVTAMPAIRGEDSWNLDPPTFAELRRARFDVALCTNTVRYLPDLASSVALGVPARVAAPHKGLSGLVTNAVAIPFPAPYPAYFRAMVAHVSGRAPGWSLRPVMYPDAADEARADHAFDRLGLGARPIVACAPLSRQPLGAWPLEAFSRSLAPIASTHDIVFVGAKSDADALAYAARAVGVPNRSLAGELDVRALSAFMRRCAAVLAQDSGPRHVANAAGTPVAFFRNLRAHPVETGPYLDTEIDLVPAALSPRDAATSGLLDSSTPARFAEFVVASGQPRNPHVSR